MRKVALFFVMIGVMAVYDYPDAVYGIHHLFAVATEPSDSVVVKGRIVQSEPFILGSRHRRRPPYRVDYDFVNSEGKSVLGSDIVFNSSHESGHPVNVTYSPSNPARNRIAESGESARAVTAVIFAIAMAGIAAVIALRPRTR